MKISIGVDGAASNEAADMISETHAAWLMQRALRPSRQAQIRRWRQGRRRGRRHRRGRGALGNGGSADVMGLDAIGRIAPGQATDIAVYSLDDPRYFGLHDPAIGPVASGGWPMLRALLVNDRMIVENDRIPGVDLLELGAAARQSRQDPAQ